ncbi:hypothetical protein SYNPS1DRAFT_26595 [Syncephalis pseudoplumigaleata]|uniref:Uncharacterized protein n=1 Tax=Syncephalis pseudoplumigaleata TaxID=1712513 RepID=A0A4P9Z580_9FUNG|nr:hypothetical protein SYNPS1DRAFT_26595 [Syncephalis pseudoplumigaleata]|eukprot:RKP27774.1 hypothetical protein SYNPS1DRAFT_26595 [Syncephalis pseudoplumigaleata]
MPTLKSYHGVPEEVWHQNATALWHILLHPAGETPILDYIADPSATHNDTQRRLWGFQTQVLIYVFAGYAFVYAGIISVRLILIQRQSLAGWSCLLSASCGIVMSGLCLFAEYLPGFNCRMLLWSFAVFKVIANISHAMVLHHRAFLALRRPFWVLIVGMLLNLMNVANFFVVIFLSFITIEPLNGCVIYYAEILPYLCFMCNTPFNAFCFAIFIYVAYKQYHRFGHNNWKYLTRDGIRTMLMALSCDITCDIIICVQALGTYSQLFFIVNWPTVLLILTNHFRNMTNPTGAYGSGTSKSKPPSLSSTAQATQSTTTEGFSMLPITTGHTRFRR